MRIYSRIFKGCIYLKAMEQYLPGEIRAECQKKNYQPTKAGLRAYAEASYWTPKHTPSRSPAGPSLCRTCRLNPVPLGCPQELVACDGRRTVPKNSCFFFQLLEILGLEFSAGASSECCLKKMRESILTLASFWFSKGAESRTLQFPTASPKVILPLPTGSNTFHYHGSETKPQFCAQVTCAYQWLECNPTVVCWRDRESSGGKMGRAPERLFVTIIRNKEEEERDKLMNNTREIARSPGNVYPGLAYNKFMLDLFLILVRKTEQLQCFLFY